MGGNERPTTGEDGNSTDSITEIGFMAANARKFHAHLNAILDIAGITKPASRAVLFAWALYIDNDRIAYPSQSSLATDARVSHATVERAMVELEQTGVVKVIRRGGGRISKKEYPSTWYRLVTLADIRKKHPQIEEAKPVRKGPQNEEANSPEGSSFGVRKGPHSAAGSPLRMRDKQHIAEQPRSQLASSVTSTGSPVGSDEQLAAATTSAGAPDGATFVVGTFSPDGLRAVAAVERIMTDRLNRSMTPRERDGMSRLLNERPELAEDPEHLARDLAGFLTRKPGEDVHDVSKLLARSKAPVKTGSGRTDGEVDGDDLYGRTVVLIREYGLTPSLIASERRLVNGCGQSPEIVAATYADVAGKAWGDPYQQRNLTVGLAAKLSGAYAAFRKVKQRKDDKPFSTPAAPSKTLKQRPYPKFLDGLQLGWSVATKDAGRDLWSRTSLHKLSDDAVLWLEHEANRHRDWSWEDQGRAVAEQLDAAARERGLPADVSLEDAIQALMTAGTPA